MPLNPIGSDQKHKSKKFSLEETLNVEESHSYNYLGIVIHQNGCIHYDHQNI
jgi:hypothetical protein